MNTFESTYTEYNSVPFRPEVDRLSAEYFYRQGTIDTELKFHKMLRHKTSGRGYFSHDLDTANMEAWLDQGCTASSPCDECRNSDRQEAEQ